MHRLNDDVGITLPTWCLVFNNFCSAARTRLSRSKSCCDSGPTYNPEFEKPPQPSTACHRKKQSKANHCKVAFQYQILRSIARKDLSLVIASLTYPELNGSQDSIMLLRILHKAGSSPSLISCKMYSVLLVRRPSLVRRVLRMGHLGIYKGYLAERCCVPYS